MKLQQVVLLAAFGCFGWALYLWFTGVPPTPRNEVMRGWDFYLQISSGLFGIFGILYGWERLNTWITYKQRQEQDRRMAVTSQRRSINTPKTTTSRQTRKP